MPEPITRHRGIESLKVAARWPGADRATTVTLAIRLAGVRADAQGYRYFSALASAQPGAALPLALAGFFQARLGEEVDAALAVPYLVIRDHFTERLYHQRTGYWQPDGRGLEPVTAAEHAAALDLLAGGREEQFAAAAATLIGQGDDALALEIIQPGLLRHPASGVLTGLRRTALHRLMEQYQQFDPFKFLIYAELAGAEIGPVG